MNYHEKIKEHTVEDAQGNITTTTTKETRAIKKSDEPDYIKLYTRMWCEFNQIPDKWRPLFMSLVCRMSYASLKSPIGGQIVCTVGTVAEAIIEECGWKNKDTLYRGLQALCNAGAIKKIRRGEYQINPQYAGKGPWRYNASTEQGGVQDLIAQFSFADKMVNTHIIWASDDPEIIGKKNDQVVATEQKITPLPGQISTDDLDMGAAANG